MPAALEAGRYISNGFQVNRHFQYVRATGLPPLAVPLLPISATPRI
jgi:hypothetical protein